MARRRKPSGRERSLRSLERRPSSREPRQCLLVVCEGERTEPNYFVSLRESLKLSTVEVEVVGIGQAPVNVVDQAVRLRKRRKDDKQRPPYDQVWCVFDRESNPPHPSFDRAVDKAQGNRLELAVSTPAFEYWCLLHFAATDRPFDNADGVVAALKVYLPDYEKGRDVYGELAPHVEAAVERARRVWENRPDPGERFPNPSTLMYLLVEELRGMD